MAKVLQIIDVDSQGHKVRLDDGRTVVAPHGYVPPHVGQEFAEAEPVEAEPCAACGDKDKHIASLEAEVAKLKAEIEEESERTPEQRAELNARIKATMEQLNSEAPVAAVTAAEVTGLETPAAEQDNGEGFGQGIAVLD